jgi:hypothetical protein
MPNPTSAQMHQNAPLQDMTVGNTQEETNFVLRQCGPFQPVDQKSNTYYVFDDGDWNRMEMAPRGPSQESNGGGWRLSTDNYRCDRWAVHKDFDWDDEANADVAVAETDSDAAEFLANQARIYGDYIFGNEVMAESVWTTDLDGTSSTVSPGTNFKYWDDSAGDPQEDIQYYQEVVIGLMGKRPNVLVVGAKTHARLMSNAAVKAAIKVTDLMGPDAIKAKMAAYLGIEKYIVGSAYRNTAAEGATKSIAYIIDSKAAWMGFVNPEIGKRKQTAFRCFAYKHKGMATDGMVVRSLDIEEKTTTRHEIECFWDVKIVNADAGVFFKGAVSA